MPTFAMGLAEEFRACASLLASLPVANAAKTAQRQSARMIEAISGVSIALTELPEIFEAMNAGSWSDEQKQAMTDALTDHAVSNAGQGKSKRVASQDFTAIVNYMPQSFWASTHSFAAAVTQVLNKSWLLGLRHPSDKNAEDDGFHGVAVATHVGGDRGYAVGKQAEAGARP